MHVYICLSKILLTRLAISFSLPEHSLVRSFKTSSSTVTSQWTKTTFASSPRDSQICFPRLSCTSAIQILAPWIWKRRTMLSPIPDAPPVTNATLTNSLRRKRGNRELGSHIIGTWEHRRKGVNHACTSSKTMKSRKIEKCLKQCMKRWY